MVVGLVEVHIMPAFGSEGQLNTLSFDWTTVLFWKTVDARVRFSALLIDTCSRYGRIRNAQVCAGLFLPPHGSVPCTSWKLCIPMPSCFRLLTHWVRRAASRAACTAGNKSA